VGLVNGETYYYRVSAFNSVGEGPLTEVRAATPLTHPDPPEDLVVEPGVMQLTLLWLHPQETGGAPVSAYRIYRRELSGSLELLRELGPRITQYIDGDVVGGRTYQYAVSAVTAAGEGPKSNVVPGTPIGLPGPPSDLIVSAGDGKVILNWDAPDDDGGSPVTVYVVLRGPSPFNLHEIAQLGEVLIYVDTDVENAKTYYYAIAAVNEAGKSAFSKVVEATPTLVAVEPGVPGPLRAEVDGNKVVLSWQAPASDGGSPITGYIVLRGTTSDDLQVITEVGTVLSYTDEGLERGRTYYYSVIAKNDVGQGEPSSVLDVDVKKKKDGPGFASVGALLAMGMASLLLVLVRGKYLRFVEK
jgi:titin